MGKLFKFIFGLIVFLVIIVVALVGLMFYLITDATDNAPTDLYAESIVLEDEIAKIFDDAINDDETRLDLAFSQDQLNLIIFSLIRKEYNQEYYKNGCNSDDCKYISSFELDEGVSVIGGKKVSVKHAYADMTDDSITFYLTVDALGIKTRLKAGFTFSSTNSTYKFTLTKLGIGKINLMSGFGKMLFEPVLNAAGFSEAKINQELQGLPITFNLNDFSFSILKSELNNLVENEDTMVKELIKVLTEENDLVNLKFFQKNNKQYFGLQVNLDEIIYDENRDGIPQYKLNFETYSEKMGILVAYLEREDFNLASKYLIYGFQGITPEEQTAVLLLDFSSIGINDISNYTGLIADFDLDWATYISDCITEEMSNIADGDIKLEIDETIMNQLLYASGLVGTGFNTYYQIDDEYKIVYSGFEALWIDIEDNKLGLKILFNFNSIRICLFTSFTNNSQEETKIEAEFEDLRIGNINLGDDIKEAILSLMVNEGMLEIKDNKIVIDSNQFLDNFQGENLLGDLLVIIQDNEMMSLSLLGASMADNGKIVFLINLEKIENQENLTTLLTEASVDFNVNTFIKNKTQSLIFSNLSLEKKIIFTNKDFNKLLYKETNGYNGFESVSSLPDNSDFKIKVKGVLFNFTSTHVYMRYVLDINGLESLIIVTSTVSTNQNETEIYLDLQDITKIGSIDLTSNDFIIDLLGNNINNLGLMSFDSTLKRFTITNDVFQEFMNVGGDSTPLDVEKIKIVNGAFEVYVTYTDPTVSTTIDNVTNVIETVLQNDFIDENLFNTGNEDDQQSVNDLVESLNNVQTVLNDPDQTLTSDETNNLIDAINQLSEENQQIFFSQIENNANSNDLSDLYDLLFGK